jgi:hypothetical protein
LKQQYAAAACNGTSTRYFDSEVAHLVGMIRDIGYLLQLSYSPYTWANIVSRLEKKNVSGTTRRTSCKVRNSGDSGHYLLQLLLPPRRTTSQTAVPTRKLGGYLVSSV